MHKAKSQAVTAAGFRVGDAEEFLELTEEERRLVELRVVNCRTVRRLRDSPPPSPNSSPPHPPA